jgi:hypothetical protein
MRSVNLAQSPEGDLVLVTDEPFPADIKRVEYYRSQKLFMLVYDQDEHEGDLMHYELPEDVAQRVEKKSSLIIVEPDLQTGRRMGYYTSLIQVGA